MEALHIRLLRDAPPWRKMEMLADLNQTVRMLALSGLRQRHNDASEGQLKRLLADLMLGENYIEKTSPYPRF